MSKATEVVIALRGVLEAVSGWKASGRPAIGWSFERLEAGTVYVMVGSMERSPAGAGFSRWRMGLSLLAVTTLADEDVSTTAIGPVLDAIDTLATAIDTARDSGALQPSSLGIEDVLRGPIAIVYDPRPDPGRLAAAVMDLDVVWKAAG